MTERLSVLLREEAQSIDVPPAATAAILSRGRARRRRRRWTVAAAAGVAVAAVSAATLGGVHQLRTDDTIDPARAAEEFAARGAFAVGHELHIGTQTVHFDDSIRAIYYTSAGVVVRSGSTDDTNDGVSTYTLVSPTGERSSIHAASSNRIPGFEPDGTAFAYASQDDGRLEVVVHDVVTDRELARVTVLDHPVETGWDAPPVSIDGDVVWVRTGPGWTAVDWRTGEVRAVPGTEDTYELQNGRYAVQHGSVWEIRAMADRSLVGEVRMLTGWYALFSPDGTLMRSFPNNVRNDDQTPDAWVHDISGGVRVKLPDAGFDLGWTPDGHLMVLDGDTVRICEPMSQSCTVEPFDGDASAVKLGGAPYES
jgi:hypothetical protein